jgi:hypothetical protein
MNDETFDEWEQRVCPLPEIDYDRWVDVVFEDGSIDRIYFVRQ